MQENEIAGARALVTGASRGFGRGIATALSKAGAQVTGVARDRAPLAELRAELGGSFTAVPAAAYAAAESVRGALGIRFVSLLPQLTPATRLGAAAVAAYAAREGLEVAVYTGHQGPALTPEQVGQAVIDLVAGPGPGQEAYLLTAAGLDPLT